MTTRFTPDQLKILEAAIADGALRVKYSDKEVEYRSLAEMLKIRDLMLKELCCVPGRKGRGLFGGRRLKMEFDKDL